jgi:hypothetical protein
MDIILQATGQKVTAESLVYKWEWDAETDLFSLFDSARRLISRGRHQPLIITSQDEAGDWLLAPKSIWAIQENTLTITYTGLNGGATLQVCWEFHAEFIDLQPLRYESLSAQDIVRVVYFAKPDHGFTPEKYTPSLYSRYVVVPGLCMSTCVSPVIDLQSRLSVSTVLGSGAMRGPGLTQQWGLPAHYFCAFNTSDRWNAIGAKSRQSGAVCWGLRNLPLGDYRLEIRENAVSPQLNIRADLWKQACTPRLLELGFSFVITFGDQYHEAIRSYYNTLLNRKIVHPKSDSCSQKKSDVILSPQYNTWGVESARVMQPEDLTEQSVLEIFNKLRHSGMQARTFVIDDKWEGQYGELRHDQVRFPHFEDLLEKIRSQGFYIGLWAAFLRCQDPAALGLDESHLLHTPAGKTLWLHHQTARYAIFDITQPAVQAVLQERARQFIRSYKPDLVKFDFGYELPSLDVAAPADKNFSGERLLQKGLQVVVGAMKAENPDLVIMYYGLSPLLLEYYDLHSPDDLVYCGGDYDLETNRRILFSSLCGELGMPTYGSSGYDWASASDIWFDSAPSGTLGSLHCFEGDENGDLPQDLWIARFNGLSAILRQETTFSIRPVDAAWQGGLRAAFSPSWERLEHGKTMLLALRTHKFDGKPASPAYKAILSTELQLVVASMTVDDIAESGRIGIVPYADGRLVLQHLPASDSTAPVGIIEHYFGGDRREYHSEVEQGRLKLDLHTTRQAQIIEWVEVDFHPNKTILRH